MHGFGQFIIGVVLMAWTFVGELFGRRSWTERHLVAAERRIEAPLSLIPTGDMPPAVARIVLESKEMKRLMKVHGYLIGRSRRKP